eukprot:14274107-Alexandrium_andersonii.AAC.1
MSSGYYSRVVDALQKHVPLALEDVVEVDEGVDIDGPIVVARPAKRARRQQPRKSRVAALADGQ